MAKPLFTAPHDGRDVEIAYNIGDLHWVKARFDSPPQGGQKVWLFVDGGRLSSGAETDQWLWRAALPTPGAGQ